MYKTWVQHRRSVKFNEFLGTNFKNMNVQKLGFNTKGVLSSMDASIWMKFFIKFGFNTKGVLSSTDASIWMKKL
jgi:hypothetical protein